MSLAELAEDLSDAFDDLKAETVGEDAKLIFLRQLTRKDRSTAFAVIHQTNVGWYPIFSEYFNVSTFMWTDLSQEARDVVYRSTNVMVIDSDNESLNNVLYELSRDTNPPLSDPFWNIRAKSLGRTYDLETEKEN